LISGQTTALAPHHSIFTGWLLFLMPNQQGPTVATAIPSSLASLWSPYGIGQTIMFSSCGFFFLSSSFFSSPSLSRRKKSPKNRPLGTIAQLCQAISSQLRHIWTIGKNLLSSNMSSTRPHNMVNFGPLGAEIGPVVSGTPANFNGFRVLAVLLHGI